MHIVPIFGFVSGNSEDKMANIDRIVDLNIFYSLIDVYIIRPQLNRLDNDIFLSNFFQWVGMNHFLNHT